MILNNKIISVLVAGIVIFSLFYFMPVSSGSTIETPFGEFEIVLSAIDSEGNRHFMKPSTITNQLLQWTHAGVDLTSIDVEIKVTATGEGFDTCEFDFSEVSPQLKYTISSDSVTHTFSQDSFTVPLDQTTKLWEDTLQMNELMPGALNTYSLDIDFLADGISFRGVTGGGTQFDLPVTGTSSSTWIQTWDTPIYMADFHWTQENTADTHHKWLDASGNWHEFDGCNGYGGSGCTEGEYTRSINDYVYGIRVGGWVYTTEASFTWDWYTDSSGTKHYSISTGGENAQPGPWETYDASFSAATNVELTWMNDDSDGDGISDDSDNCPNTPNPDQSDTDNDGIGDACDSNWCGDGVCNGNEDCHSCPEDCGTCNCQITDIDWDLTGDLTTDSCSPRLHIYDYTGGTGWNTPWMYYHQYSNCANTPSFTCPEDFDCAKGVSFEYYVRADASGTLEGSVHCHGPNGENILCEYSDWSDIQYGGISVSSGNWYNIGAYTWDMVSNGDWTIDIDITLHENSVPNTAPMVDIVSAPPIIDPNSEYIWVEYDHDDAEDGTLTTTIDWEDPGDPSDDTYYGEGTSQTYTRDHQVSMTHAQTGSGSQVKVTVEDSGGLTASDSIWVSFTIGFQFVSNGLFSIFDYETQFDTYEHNGNYLGG